MSKVSFFVLKSSEKNKKESQGSESKWIIEQSRESTERQGSHPISANVHRDYTQEALDN